MASLFLNGHPLLCKGFGVSTRIGDSWLQIHPQKETSSQYQTLPKPQIKKSLHLQQVSFMPLHVAYQLITTQLLMIISSYDGRLEGQLMTDPHQNCFERKCC